MKADKDFYNKLRDEIRDVKNDVSTNFMTISKGITTNVSSDCKNSRVVNDNKEILALRERVDSLLSQVNILKEQNSDLTKKNKSLEEELSNVRSNNNAGNILEEIVTTTHDNENQYYISIEKIAKWSFAQGEEMGGMFKEMVYDLDINVPVAIKSLLKEYEMQYKQSSLPPTVGTVIMQQEIHHQVNGVKKGATGITINNKEK